MYDETTHGAEMLRQTVNRDLIDTLRQTAETQLARHGVTIQRLIESEDGLWRAVLRQTHNDDGCFTQMGTPLYTDPVRLLVEITETAQSLEDLDVNIFSSNLFPYISGEMIGDNEITLTIKHVKEEELRSSSGSEKKPVMYFKERDKGLILNKTNAKSLAVEFGPETTKWHGRRVVLYAERGVWFGNAGYATRVRPLKEAPPKAATNGDTPAALFDEELEADRANAGAYAE